LERFIGIPGNIVTGQGFSKLLAYSLLTPAFPLLGVEDTAFSVSGCIVAFQRVRDRRYNEMNKRLTTRRRRKERLVAERSLHKMIAGQEVK
jgi:hypothetical protein